jgi:H+/Cl- antiporter ClcA
MNEQFSHAGHSLRVFVEYGLLALLTGVVVGLVGTAFSYVLHEVTQLRTTYPQLLFALPVAGLIIVALYQFSHGDVSRGTNLIIEAARNEADPPAAMAPRIFIATALTHLCGGSAGREGAALQLGGSIGGMISRGLRLDKMQGNVLVLCGMSAAFAALFGTPITAAVFSIELAAVGIMQYGALVPCAISATVASLVAARLGVEPESFILEPIALSPANLLRVLVLGVLCAAIGMLLCVVMHGGSHLATRLVPNPALRVVIGAAVIICATLLLGTRDYLGAGMDVITRAIEEGTARPEAFLLKLLFTSVTLGCGFKGGEIVPTFFIGATFGCVVGPLLGLDPRFAAALGLVCMFCAVTNCPITSLLLSFELFGFVSPVLFLIALAVSYMLSDYYSLYSTQLFVIDKLNPIAIDRRAR